MFIFAFFSRILLATKKSFQYFVMFFQHQKQNS
jgi:hypothetical protein